MDALSATKLVTTAPAGGLSAQPAQDVASVGKSIPAAELQQLGSVNSDNPLQATSGSSSTGGANFANMLGGLVNDVAQKQAEAGSAVTGLLSGQNVSLHQAMISMEEANVSFQMMVEVRNRLLDSYQELMRMQI
ncbi:MAG TPA: flagellar hook-basal body complex protein FliE [Verrucomicrobiae bacterium]|jgi:flagellar hook-basal body complex protein FliE|nr:flagellar hook-basal body complex protein FliE [Verrucomicrobiae bacterium]